MTNPAIPTKRGNCGCPHGCNEVCDSQGRCPTCWNGGKGCPHLFGKETKPETPSTGAREWREKVYGYKTEYFRTSDGVTTNLANDFSIAPGLLDMMLEAYHQSKLQEVAQKASGEAAEKE